MFFKSKTEFAFFRRMFFSWVFGIKFYMLRHNNNKTICSIGVIKNFEAEIIIGLGFEMNERTKLWVKKWGQKSPTF